MGDVLIRDLDKDVIDAMTSKAKLYGRSLEGQLRAVIEAAAPFTPEERVEASRRLREGQEEIKDFDVRTAEEIFERASMTKDELEAMFQAIDKLFPNGPIDVCVEDIIREEREARP